VERCYQTKSFWADATVVADYTITTTTKMTVKR